MKLPVKLLKTKTGVKAAAILLIVTFMIITFTSMTMGAPGVTYGDVNNDGDIDVRDVVLVMQHIIGLRNLTEDQLKAADVNGDGTVDVQDATMIMQHVLGIKELAVAVESVKEVEISVPYGTPVDSIDFPDTVTAVLQDESEEEIAVEWESTSDPTYKSQSPDEYTFKGDLVNLPAGIANPDQIQATAVVTVEKINVPEYRSPTPDPTIIGEIEASAGEFVYSREVINGSSADDVYFTPAEYVYFVDWEITLKEIDLKAEETITIDLSDDSNSDLVYSAFSEHYTIDHTGLQLDPSDVAANGAMITLTALEDIEKDVKITITVDIGVTEAVEPENIFEVSFTRDDTGKKDTATFSIAGFVTEAFYQLTSY